MTTDVMSWLGACEIVTSHYFRVYGVDGEHCACWMKSDCTAPGKHPKGKWPDLAASVSRLSIHELVERGADNYGVALNEHGLVLDFDGAQGAATFEYLRSLFPNEMATLSIRTQSGGRHVYLKIPANIGVLQNSVRVLPGLDIRTKGGYVIGPGSKGISGSYSIIAGNETLVEATEELLWATLTHPKLRQVKCSAIDPIPEGQRDSTVFKILCGLRGRGLDHAELQSCALGINAFCTPPLSFDQLMKKAEQASKYERGEIAAAAAGASGKRSESPIQTQVVDLLRADAKNGRVIAFDEFLQRIVIAKSDPAANAGSPELAPFDDFDLAKIRDEYARRLDVSISADCASLAVDIVARENSFNSLANEIAKLEWDFKPRVDKLFPAYFGSEDSPTNQAISRIFLLSAVRRALEPGCKVDTTVIIEGPQGIGKSQALKILGGRYFASPYLDLRSKDVYHQIQGLWIIELPELASFEGKSANLIKSFLSTEVDHYRPAYGRHSVTRPRSCVFVGTTNDDCFLTDPTGNRRFLPIVATRIDLENLQRDRENLIAEAYLRVTADEPWWPTEEEGLLFAITQEEKIVRDPWEDKLSDLFKSQPDKSWSNLEIFAKLQMPIHTINRSLQTRLGQLMKRMGFQRVPNSKPALYQQSKRLRNLQLCEPEFNKLSNLGNAHKIGAKEGAGVSGEWDDEVTRLDEQEDLA